MASNKEKLVKLLDYLCSDSPNHIVLLVRAAHVSSVNIVCGMYLYINSNVRSVHLR